MLYTVATTHFKELTLFHYIIRYLLPHKCVVMYNKIPLMTIEVIPIPAHIIILYELNLLLKFITGDEKMQIS